MWLVEVAEGASRDAGGVPVELLGDYLPLLADAAIKGRRAKHGELDAVGLLGRRPPSRGSPRAVVQLYLSAARRLWQDLPMVVRSRDRRRCARPRGPCCRSSTTRSRPCRGDAVARRDLVRREETLRRELIDDLLRGDSDLGTLVERAEPFGLDLARVHQVALAAPSRRLPDADAAISALEAVVFDRLGDRDVLVATKDGLLVVLAPADAGAPAGAPGLDARNELGQLMHRELSRCPAENHGGSPSAGPTPACTASPAPTRRPARRSPWPAGSKRTPLSSTPTTTHLPVLLRDQPAIVDLVQAVLSPLTQARGGAGPLLGTLHAYFATGAVATESAKRLHVSVRTVTYRLARVKTLTGYDPADPAHRFTLQAAVLGAKVLNWPQEPLPIPV